MAQFHTRLAVGTIVALAIGTGISAHAEPVTAQDCISQGNVWVHVEHDDVVTGGCAEEFATALEATRSAGLTEESGSFVTTVAGRTADATTGREWWSLWSAQGDPEGKAPEWAFASVGADQLPARGGDMVAWRLDPDWNKSPAAPPSVNPLSATADGPVAPELRKVGLPPVGVPGAGA